MVFWINTKKFDFYKKRVLLAIIIVMMASPWLPIAKELFFGIMNTEIYAGLMIGHVVSILGVLGAWGLYKRWF